MKKIVINVNCMHVQNITGIPRYVYEILKKLDDMIVGTGLEVEAVYKNDAPIILPKLKNIRVIEYNTKKSFNKSIVPKYIRKEKAILVSMGTTPMLVAQGIGCLHDIRPLVMKGDSIKFRVWHIALFLTNVLFCQRIVTVSDYQRQLIHKKLYYPLRKIEVIHSAWDHFDIIETDEGVFERIKGIRKGDFFYTLGSIAPHKNYKWIYEVAKKNPDQMFVVAGGKDLSVWGEGENVDLPNIIYPGFVTDEESKALMTNAKAFILPSKFEGFGLPPLEALSCGTKIFLSSATCLPEIYKNCAVYFDPDDYDVNLVEMLKQNVASPDILLNEYTWEHAARKWLDLFLEIAK